MKLIVALLIVFSPFAGAVSRAEQCVASSKLDAHISDRARPNYISGDFVGNGVTGIAVRIVDKSSSRLGVLFCLHAKSTFNSFVILEDADVGFSSNWRKLKLRELKQLRIDFDNVPQAKGEVLGMFWEGAGVAVLFWNGSKIEYRILNLRTDHGLR